MTHTVYGPCQDCGQKATVARRETPRGALRPFCQACADRPRSYDEALAFFKTHAKAGTLAAKLGPNILLVRSECDYDRTISRWSHSYAVRLYETDILTFYTDGTFSAQDGGWNTPTTIATLNRYAPRGWRFEHRKRRLVAVGATAPLFVQAGERYRIGGAS